MDEAEKSKRDYNKAFLLCADTLEDLRIDTSMVSGLPCLPSMSRLRYLEASLMNIFRSHNEALTGVANICDHLPPSLESISLLEWSWYPWPPRTRDWPRREAGSKTGTPAYACELLAKARSGLLGASREKLPRLRRVRIEVDASACDEAAVRRLPIVRSLRSRVIRIDCILLHGDWHTTAGRAF